MTTQMKDHAGPTPTTLRFTTGWTNCGRQRMSLIQFQDRKSPGKSPAYREALLFKVDLDQIKKFWNSSFCSERSARLGTCRRYRHEVEAARAVIAQVGWTLTPDEESLLQAIEAYGREHAAERAAA